jgi:hypothetical protein
MIKKILLIFLTIKQLELLASEAPSSSISKNQQKSFKPGHFCAKIMLFRTRKLMF